MKSGRVLQTLNTRIASRPKSIKPKDRLTYWKIIRGDQVIVTSGVERGKTGNVIKVNRKINSVIVAGLNLAHKHVPMSKESPTGRVRKEMPLHVSNLALINPETGLAAKVQLRKYLNPDTGASENRRFVHGTNIELPRPKYLEYQDKWKDSVFDTLPEVVSKVTFTPSLAVPPLPESVLDELRGRYSKFRRIKEKNRRELWQKEDAEIAALSKELSAKASLAEQPKQ